MGYPACLRSREVIYGTGLYFTNFDFTEAWKSTTTFVIHYDDVIMAAIASQITSLMIVYSTVYSDADQRKHQSAASLAFVWGIHRGPVNSPRKWPVTRKMFPFDSSSNFIPNRKQSTSYMSKDTSVNQYTLMFCWWSPEKPKAHLAGNIIMQRACEPCLSSIPSKISATWKGVLDISYKNSESL